MFEVYTYTKRPRLIERVASIEYAEAVARNRRVPSLIKRDGKLYSVYHPIQ